MVSIAGTLGLLIPVFFCLFLVHVSSHSLTTSWFSSLDSQGEMSDNSRAGHFLFRLSQKLDSKAEKLFFHFAEE